MTTSIANKPNDSLLKLIKIVFDFSLTMENKKTVKKPKGNKDEKENQKPKPIMTSASKDADQKSDPPSFWLSKLIHHYWIFFILKKNFW